MKPLPQSDRQAHWDSVYRAKAFDAVSWYQPHLQRSFELIRRIAPDLSAAIIDVGGGEATLVEDLLDEGYRNLTVLDISATAIDFARAHAGSLAEHVTWRVADVTRADLPPQHYDVWHDRAVFHFLTDAAQRAAYVRHVSASVKHGGYVMVATFGPQGPLKCSGLDVLRYDAQSLHSEFGEQFRLIDSAIELHHTPAGATQQFLYCLCRVQ